MSSTTFGTVGPPWWSDRPVLVVGTGPSLAGLDFNVFRDRGYVLAVKEAVWDLPFADACFGLDLPWMRRRCADLTELATRMPLYLGAPDQEPAIHAHIDGATLLRRLRTDQVGGLSTSPGAIEYGGNSGFGAFNLAVLKRARIIYLFGFDYTADHYCNDRYAHHPRDHNARYWPRWAQNFRAVISELRRANIEVINASPHSTVDAFPKVTIEQALERLDRLR